MKTLSQHTSFPSPVPPCLAPTRSSWYHGCPFTGSVSVWGWDSYSCQMETYLPWYSRGSLYGAWTTPTTSSTTSSSRMWWNSSCFSRGDCSSWCSPRSPRRRRGMRRPRRPGIVKLGEVLQQGYSISRCQPRGSLLLARLISLLPQV